jgi:hypothetical protein
VAIDDPLTPAEQGEVNRNLPVLGKNPPGIDLGAVLNQFRDSIEAEIAAEVAAGLADALQADLPDPGNGGTITVVAADTRVAIVTGGVETRTLAAPASVGQKLLVFCQTHIGNASMTAPAIFDAALNNGVSFIAAGGAVAFVSILDAGVTRWQLAWNDGVTLTSP